MNYKLALAGLAVTAAMYMQLPLLPMLLEGGAVGFTPLQTAAVVAMPGVGVFALGCFCSYLVQHFRRNMVCIAALLVLALCSCALYYLMDTVPVGGGIRLRLSLSAGSSSCLPVLLALRFVQGAVFGLAQMVLSSTLVIDTCKSPRRTAANQTAAWFARFALALGPLLSLAWFRYKDSILEAAGVGMAGDTYFYAVCSTFSSAMLVSAALCVVAALLVMSVRFPFKAPEDIVPHVSSDRFFLGQGRWLFVNFALVAVTAGLFVSYGDTVTFYVMLMFGLLAALMLERCCFTAEDAQGDVSCGFLLVSVAALGLFWSGKAAVSLVAPLLAGCGLGLLGTRFLSLFITLSPHCRRGTAQSTFFLSWEFGLYAGIFIGYGLFAGCAMNAVGLALAVSLVALVMYSLFTRKWYIRHKNR